MECVSWCHGDDEVHICVAKVFEMAKNEIFLSVGEFQWNALIGIPRKKKLFISYVKDAIKRGVKVNILRSEESLRPKVEQKAPQGCIVHYVDLYGPKTKDEVTAWPFGFLKWLPPLALVGEKSIYSHNQGYLLMDEELAIVGPLNLALKPDLMGSFSEQKIKYMPICAVIKPDGDFIRAVRRNFNSKGRCSIPAPDRFFFGQPQFQMEQKENPEHQLLQNMILNSKHSLLIQTESFLSHAGTENKIAYLLASRIARGIQDPKDKIQIILLTNATAPQHFQESYDCACLALTATFLLKTFGLMGIHDAEQIKQHFFLGSVQTNHEVTYFRGTTILQDGEAALVTSSRIHDRSLALHHCSEMGALVRQKDKNQLVNMLQHRALQIYLGLMTPTDEPKTFYSFAEYLKMCYNEKGHVVRYRLPSTSYVRSLGMIDFVKDKILGRVF